MSAYRHPLAIVVLVLLICSACEKRLDFEEDELPPVMVVYAFAEPGGEFSARVTTSRSTLATEYEQTPLLGSCTLHLFKDGIEIETSNESDGSQYLFDSMVEEGQRYSLRVDHPAYGTVSAETIVPLAPTSIEVTVVDENEGVTIDVRFVDIPQADRYQLIVIAEYEEFNEIIGWSTNSEYFEIDPLEGESYFYRNGFFLDDIFEDSQADLRITLGYYGYYGSGELENVKVVLRSCSEDYYLFYRSRYAYLESEIGLFSEPVQIYTNVDGGLGVFGGFNDIKTPLVQ